MPNEARDLEVVYPPRRLQMPPPRQVPNNLIEIDWTNPLTQGLLVASIGDKFYTVDGRDQAFRQGGQGYDVTLEARARGRGFKQVTGEGLDGTAPFLDQKFSDGGYGAVSMMAHVHMYAASDNDTVVSLAKSGDSIGRGPLALCINGSNKPYAMAYNSTNQGLGSGTTALSAIPVGDDAVFGGSVNTKRGGTDDIRIYYNGDVQAGNFFNAEYNDGGAGYKYLVGRQRAASWNGQFTKGIVYGTWMWERELSDDEWASLTADPYQIFKPVVPMLAYREKAVDAYDRAVTVSATSSVSATATVTASFDRVTAIASTSLVSVTATVTTDFDRAATIASTATMSASAEVTTGFDRAAAMSSASTVSVTATVTTDFDRTASIASTSAMAAAANVTSGLERSAAMTATSAVSASAARSLPRDVAMASTTAMTTSATVTSTTGRTVSVTGASSVSADASVTFTRQIAVSAVSATDVTASLAGVDTRTCSVSAVSGASTTASVTRARSVTIAASATLTVADGAGTTEFLRTSSIAAASAAAAIYAASKKRAAAIAAASDFSAVWFLEGKSQRRVSSLTASANGGTISRTQSGGIISKPYTSGQ